MHVSQLVSSNILMKWIGEPSFQILNLSQIESSKCFNCCFFFLPTFNVRFYCLKCHNILFIYNQSHLFIIMFNYLIGKSTHVPSSNYSGKAWKVQYNSNFKWGITPLRKSKDRPPPSRWAWTYYDMMVGVYMEENFHAMKKGTFFKQPWTMKINLMYL